MIKIKTDEQFFNRFKDLELKLRSLSGLFQNDGMEASEEEVEDFLKGMSEVRDLAVELAWDSRKRIKALRNKTHCEACGEETGYTLSNRTVERTLLLKPFTIEETYAACNVCGEDVYHEESATETLSKLSALYKKEVYGGLRR